MYSTNNQQMSKGFLIGSSTALTVFIITLALSTFGLGREEHDKSSAAYQAASSFTMISATGIIVSLLLLIFAILRVPGASSSVQGMRLPYTPTRMY